MSGREMWGEREEKGKSEREMLRRTRGHCLGASEWSGGGRVSSDCHCQLMKLLVSLGMSGYRSWSLGYCLYV